MGKPHVGKSLLIQKLVRGKGGGGGERGGEERENKEVVPCVEDDGTCYQYFEFQDTEVFILFYFLFLFSFSFYSYFYFNFNFNFYSFPHFFFVLISFPPFLSQNFL